MGCPSGLEMLSDSKSLPLLPPLFLKYKNDCSRSAGGGSSSKRMEGGCHFSKRAQPFAATITVHDGSAFSTLHHSSSYGKHRNHSEINNIEADFTGGLSEFPEISFPRV